jgi:hypothetical protein
MAPPGRSLRQGWAFVELLARALVLRVFGMIRLSQNPKKRSFSPFQSGLALVHTARTL